MVGAVGAGAADVGVTGAAARTESARAATMAALSAGLVLRAPGKMIGVMTMTIAINPSAMSVRLSIYAPPFGAAHLRSERV